MSDPDPHPLAPVALIPRAALAFGLTAKAIRRKIEEGVWLEGHEYHRAPDGHIWVDIEGVRRWAKGGRAAA